MVGVSAGAGTSMGSGWESVLVLDVMPKSVSIADMTAGPAGDRAETKMGLTMGMVSVMCTILMAVTISVATTGLISAAVLSLKVGLIDDSMSGLMASTTMSQS